MTIKLFENNQYQKSCVAVVTACELTKRGFAVELDQTVFFPEGGGQLSDKGKLGEATVSYVGEDGEHILHYCDKPLAVGSSVEAVIDWPLRLDHMQQHSGEHILSYAIWKLFKVSNFGFHMNEESVGIDLERELTPEELAQAEDYANNELWQNKPITIKYIPHTDLGKYEMRKKNDKITGTLRLVCVEDGDICTCCGTHVERTGAVGAIHIIRSERYKQGQRIEFLCGNRALRDARNKNAYIWECARLLAVKPEQAATGIKRLQEEIADLKAALRLQAEKQYMRQLPQWQQAIITGASGHRYALIMPEDCTPDGVKFIAQQMTAVSDAIVCVYYLVGERLNYLFATPEGNSVDCRELCKRANALFGGKGGGKSNYAQGSAAASGDWQNMAQALCE